MWIFLILASSVCLVLVVALCACWGRQRQKDDWLGVDGMVTQTNPDENVNHLPFSTGTGSDTSVTQTERVTREDEIDSKRPATTNNTRRSLPDIPSESLGVWDPNGDNSSELYATVEPYHLAKRHTLPNGIDNRAGNSQHSSICQTDDVFSPYASVNYDKLKKLEHPYAIVKTTEHNEEEATVRTNLLNDRPSTSQVSETPPASHSRRNSTDSSGPDINAASAVAGGIAASQELPYMTPPIGMVAQLNFSGDSQDSSKGYTSISVREPLANIIAQTKEVNKTKKLDPHYSTVSDDSDEMYTTIPDPNQEYTSGSETYAQIQPLALIVAAEINPVPSSSSPTACTSITTTPQNETSPQPQPPSVDVLKHMTHSHSRQASSSSSILNLGSPKPEKRQANSPLPPPPSTSPDAKKNLDDMYAKVQKNRKKNEDSESETNESIRKASVASVSSNSSVEEKKVVAMVPKEMTHNYETLKSRKNSDPGYEKLDVPEPNYASIDGPDSLTAFPPYEEVQKNPDHGYSTIKENVLAGYSVVNKQHKKNLEIAKSSTESEDPNYESMSQSEPNYESVKYLDVSYERLNTDDESSQDSSGNKLKHSGYETVESGSGSSERNYDEPPYEKLGGEIDTECVKHDKNTGAKPKNDLVVSDEIKNDSVRDDKHVKDIKTDKDKKKKDNEGSGEDEIYQV